MERKEWMKDGKHKGKSVKTEVSQETSVQKKEIPGGLPQNLSDFTLFQSVMKNKEAHEIVLGMILEESNLQLEAIRVEEVILNDFEKRAIRLDAWAEACDTAQYNTEMQNDVQSDNIRKRARFYQGLIDSPILKSGQP